MNIQKLERGSVLLCALLTILVISLVGANVLVNSTTRYNVTSKQVKGWKEALIAAEAGGDTGYAECRKTIGDPNVSTIFTNDGWAVPSPAPANLTWTKSVPAFGQDATLSATVTVDVLPANNINPPSTNNYYRIRATGTAKVMGLRRTGMDDRMSLTTRGDSLLRKIDFSYDHFKATYGDGDGNSPQVSPVPYPQISRRIELIATPVDPFEGALKCVSSFSGPGPASVIDSYDSHNTPPPGASPVPANSNYYFAANNPNDPHYADSRNGNVAVNAPNFADLQSAPIYGNVGTNGGNVTHSAYPAIYGTIDNSISFTVPPITQPTGITYQAGSPNTITPSATAKSAATPDWYLYSGDLPNNFGINALSYTDPVTHVTKPVETYVNVVVTGNIGGNGNPSVTIANGVTAKIYFAGNYSVKASNTNNNNVDGAPGVLMVDPNNAANYVQSDNTSRASHMQFYGINPPAGQTQTIDTNPGGGASNAKLWAVFYAPGADFTMNGNPDLFGAVVCRTFYGNGNTGFHYDKALKWLSGPPVDYRIASYVEDIR
ncbi:MAG TPA: hypothetical protein VGH08_03215 [Chthoniobacterales bacterium]